MTTLENILHLASWNGYAKDIRQASYVSYDAYSDERLMFPYGIRLRFGNNRGWVHHLISTINTVKDSNAIVNRLKDVIKMAKLTHHMKLFEEVLRYEDSFGESALIDAINKKSLVLVKFLMENGADVNQTDKCGRNILEVVNSLDETTDSIQKVVKKSDGKYVIRKIYGTRIKEIRDYLVNTAVFSVQSESDKLKNLQKKRDWDESERIKRRVVRGIGGIGGHNDVRMFDHRNLMMHEIYDNMWIHERFMMNHGMFIMGNNFDHVPKAPKAKRLKSKQYKQQFGR
jgi:hypothetical protein